MCTYVDSTCIDIGTTEVQMATSTAEETPLSRILRTQGRMKTWLAEELNVPRVRITRLCAGTARMHADEAVEISKLLGCAIEDLLPASPAASSERE